MKKKAGGNDRTGQRWTLEESRSLAKEWGADRSRSFLCALLGRPWSAIRKQAQALKLAAGVPQGWVTLAEAMRLTGYTKGALLRIFELADVPTRRARPGPFSRAQEGRRIWDRDRAIEAAEDYTNCKLKSSRVSVSEASISLDVRRDDVIAADNFARKTYGSARLDPGADRARTLDDWRAVLEAWRRDACREEHGEEAETLGDAAARLGLDRKTLRARAARLGRPTTRAGWDALARGDTIAHGLESSPRSAPAR